MELECSDDVILKRFKEKKVDPVTGIVYDRLNPANDPEISRRLQENPNETSEIVAKR